MEQILQLDGQLLIWIQNFFRSDFLDKFFSLYTRTGDYGEIWIVLGIILLFFKKTRTSGILLLGSLLLTHIINTVWIKNLVDRARPYTVLEDLTNIIGPVSQSSFPSGHTATAFGSAMVLFFREKKFLRWIPFILACLMGFSRLYLGVHYPLDVLAGAVLGTIIAALVVWVAALFSKRKVTIKTEKRGLE